MSWYVVFVETNKEDEVQKWLNYHFDRETLSSLIPKRRLLEKKQGKTYHVIRKLFPSYVFIRTDMDIDKYRIIMSIPRLIRVLNTGTYYSQIDDAEIAVILKLIGDDSIIDYSKVFMDNSKILVKEGPLFGMEGTIKKVDRHRNRVKVQLNFMGEPRVVDMGVEILYKLD